ncbi:hypothetical protein [Agrobacterium sp.]|nr:hypothetical protein [Agrobacterium sp.]
MTISNSLIGKTHTKVVQFDKDEIRFTVKGKQAKPRLRNRVF